MTASDSRRYLMRAALCLAVGSTGFFGCARLARGQTQVGPARIAPDADIPVAVATPGLTEAFDRALTLDEVEASDAPAFPEFLPETLPPP